MSDPVTDASKTEAVLAGLVQKYQSLISLLGDGQVLRDAKAAYLTATDSGNRALLALITGFEQPPYPVLGQLLTWLMEELVFKPADQASDPEIRDAGNKLRQAFGYARACERAQLSLVKR